METLVFIITSFCSIKDPKVSEEYKFNCMELMTNCSIVGDGQTSRKQVELCQEKWLRDEYPKLKK